MTNSVYDQLLVITRRRLGPLSASYICRQISDRFNKPPEQLTHQDLFELIDWLKERLSLLSHDRHLINEYASDLYQLAAAKFNSKHNYAEQPEHSI